MNSVCRRTNAMMLLLLHLIGAPVFLQAQVQYDFNADGISDLVYVGVDGQGALSWKAILSSTEEEFNVCSSFGQSEDSPVIGFWADSSNPSPVVLQYDPDSEELIWKFFRTDNTISEKQYGRKAMLAIAGADFDGNGILDAAVVRRKGNKWEWAIKTNIFAGQNVVSKKQIFGRIDTKVFFLNIDGISDRLATFGMCSKKYACIHTMKFRTRKRQKLGSFPRSLAAENKYGKARPMAIKSPDGRDVVAFITRSKNDQRLRVYSRKGRLLFDRTIPLLGPYVFGDFIAEEAGEEVAFQSGNNIVILNPFENGRAVTRANVNGIIIGDMSFKTLTPSSTPIPTAVPTAIQSPSPTPKG